MATSEFLLFNIYLFLSIAEKQYEVTYYSEYGVTSGLYNIVLIAAPLQPHIAGISFSNFNAPIPEIARPYHQTVITIVRGHINATFSGFGDPSPFKLRSIFTMENQNYSLMA